MMGIYGGNSHIPAENVLCLLRMWVKGTMNLLPEWGRGAVGAGECHRGLERNHSQLWLLITTPQPSIFTSWPHLTPSQGTELSRGERQCGQGVPVTGALSVGHMPIHWWVLTDLAGWHHLQALFVCADATSGAQVTLVEGTPVWGKGGGEMGCSSLLPQLVITLVKTYQSTWRSALEHPRPQSTCCPRSPQPGPSLHGPQQGQTLCWTQYSNSPGC